MQCTYFQSLIINPWIHGFTLFGIAVIVTIYGFKIINALKKKIDNETSNKIQETNKPIYKINEFGTKAWWLNGKRHRTDGPAIERADGSKAWYLNGKLHREDGPAIECADGYKVWYLNGKLHREDGPAVEYADGDKHWYLNGKRHREDGPAVEYANGDKCWCLNDKKLDPEEATNDPELKLKYPKLIDEMVVYLVHES